MNQKLKGASFRPRDANCGSSDQLRALADGYFGLNRVFLANDCVMLAIRFTRMVEPDMGLTAPALLVLFGARFVRVFVLSMPGRRKIAFGKGSPESGTHLASLLMALNSVLCCGIMGCVVMRQIALSKMKKCRIRTGILSV